MIDALTLTPVARAVGFALVDFLWQGAAIGLAAALLLAALRHASSNARYLVACFSLVTMTMTPVLTVVAIVDGPRASRLVVRDVPVPGARLDSGALAVRVVAVDPATPSAWTTWQARLEPRLPIITFLWCLGVFALTLRLLRSWIVVERVRRGARRAVGDVLLDATRRIAGQLGIRRELRVSESEAVDVPTVVGWLRPAILVPVSALAQLSPSQLEAIVAHELAHIRRHDYLVNGLQHLVETLFFYHPAVWWLSSRVRIEREHCCDDLAVSVCGSPIAYARALATLEESRQEALAFALNATGGALLPRIQRLLGPRPTPGRRPAMSLVVVALMVVAGAFLGGRVESPAAEAAGTGTVSDRAPDSIVTGRAPSEAATGTGADREDTSTLAAVETEQVPAQEPRSTDSSTDKFLSDQLKEMEGRLADLRTHLSARHPDIVRMNMAIETLRAKLEASPRSPDGQVAAQPVTATAQTLVTAQEDQLRLAKMRHDTGALARLLNDACVLTDQNGRTYDKAQAIDQYRIARLDSISLGSPAIAVAGTTATVTGTEVDVSDAVADVMLFTRVWTKGADNTWSLLSGSQSRDPRALSSADAVRLSEAAMTMRESLTVTGTSGGRATPPPPPPPPGAALRVGGDVKEPLKIKDVLPAYPKIALASNVQGLVIMEVDVDASGVVRNPRVLRSVPLLDQAAIDAVLQWRYAPAMLNGVPVAGRMTVMVPFTTGANASGVAAAPPSSQPPAAPAPPGTLRVGGTVREPRKIRDAKPVYPIDAQAAQAEGLVILEATIDRDGNVADARIMRSQPLLDQAALDAVRQWKYSPALLNGEPVGVIMTVTVNFTLQK